MSSSYSNMYKKTQMPYHLASTVVNSNITNHQQHSKQTDSVVTIQKSQYQKLLKNLSFYKQKRQNAIDQKDQFQMKYNDFRAQFESLKKQYEEYKKECKNFTHQNKQYLLDENGSYISSIQQNQATKIVSNQNSFAQQNKEINLQSQISDLTPKTDNDENSRIDNSSPTENQQILPSQQQKIITEPNIEESNITEANKNIESSIQKQLNTSKTCTKCIKYETEIIANYQTYQSLMSKFQIETCQEGCQFKKSSSKISQIQLLKVSSNQQSQQQKTQEGQQISPEQQNLEQSRIARKQCINKHQIWSQKFNDYSLFKSYILKSFKNKQSVQDLTQFQTFKLKFVKQLQILNGGIKEKRNSEITKEQDINFSQTFENILKGFTNILLEKFKDYKGKNFIQDISIHQNFSHITYVIYKLKKSELQAKQIIKARNDTIQKLKQENREENQKYQNLASQLRFYKEQFTKCLNGANMIIQAKNRLTQFQKQKDNDASTSSGSTSHISQSKTPYKSNQNSNLVSVKNSLTSTQIKKNNYQNNQQYEQIRNTISFQNSTKLQRNQPFDNDPTDKIEDQTIAVSNNRKSSQQQNIQRQTNEDIPMNSRNQNSSCQESTSKQLQTLEKNNLKTSTSRQSSLDQDDTKQQALKKMSQRQNNINNQQIASQTQNVMECESVRNKSQKLENNLQFQKTSNQEENTGINIQTNETHIHIENYTESIEKQTNLDIQQIEPEQVKIYENQFQETEPRKQEIINHSPQQSSNDNNFTEMSVQTGINVQNHLQINAINQPFAQNNQNPFDNQFLNMDYQHQANPLSNDIQNQPQQIQNEKESQSYRQST